MSKPHICRTCRFLDVPPDKLGRIKPRADKTYRCLATQPELPPLPLSITQSYGFHWPPSRSYVSPDQDTECPVWEERVVDDK